MSLFNVSGNVSASGLFSDPASLFNVVTTAAQNVTKPTDIIDVAANALKTNAPLVNQALTVVANSQTVKSVVNNAPLAPPVIPVIQGSAAASGSATAGQKMQSDYAAYMIAKNEVLNYGISIINTNPILKAGMLSLAIKGKTAAESTKGEDQQHGYGFAIGMVSRNSSSDEISAYQKKLNPSEQIGFNIGCAVMIGLHHITPTGDNLIDFGAAVAYGLHGSNDIIKNTAVQSVGTNPSVGQAIIAIAQQQQIKRGWIHRILVKLGFIKE